MVPGSNLMHTIYNAFSIKSSNFVVYLSLCCEKDKKRPGLAHIFKMNKQMSHRSDLGIKRESNVGLLPTENDGGHSSRAETTVTNSVTRLGHF